MKKTYTERILSPDMGPSGSTEISQDPIWLPNIDGIDKKIQVQTFSINNWDNN